MTMAYVIEYANDLTQEAWLGEVFKDKESAKNYLANQGFIPSKSEFYSYSRELTNHQGTEDAPDLARLEERELY